MRGVHCPRPTRPHAASAARRQLCSSICGGLGGSSDLGGGPSGGRGLRSPEREQLKTLLGGDSAGAAPLRPPPVGRTGEEGGRSEQCPYPRPFCEPDQRRRRGWRRHRDEKKQDSSSEHGRALAISSVAVLNNLPANCGWIDMVIAAFSGGVSSSVDLVKDLAIIYQEWPHRIMAALKRWTASLTCQRSDGRTDRDLPSHLVIRMEQSME